MLRPTLCALSLALALLPTAAGAQQVGVVPVGARIRIMVPDLTRAWIVGRMVSADSTLVVIDPEQGRWGKPLFLGQTSVSQLQVSRGIVGTRRNRGAVIGTLVGLGVGAYAARAAGRQEASSGEFLLLPLFAFGGTGIGAAIGSTMKEEGWDAAPLPVRVALDRRGVPGFSVAASFDN
ncbi:MAG TPA: hypothetical protein VHG28_01800 [Longimicrobiaceae bacterium]|nr:hypothetical protein [Longimicrobiaceae bacterium]